ncbi:MAG: translesion error-prone DNA polymerase V autoproteolytic subunit [Burkholderiales bacterium]|nr:translesion error-prone DNA polymerase V autoproteolytic subunit [Burkholderiales bacterium]
MNAIEFPHPSTELTLLQERVPVASLPIPWKTRTFGQRIPAGFPSPAADYIEKGLDLNEYLIVHKSSTFMFTVAGHSMKNAGILDGDQVLADRAIEPRHRHIVIAVVNQEFTIKRLYMQRGIIELRPENPDYQPIRFSDFDELQIWGVVSSLVRRFRI